MAKGLSKSRYTLFCQCPKTLWLRTYKPDEATVDAGVEARFESGNEVGDLAMGLFGPFVEVTTKREDGSLDLQAMINKTKDEMAKGTEVICEASFTFDNNYCAVDILRKSPGGWAIYEVKSSSFPEFEGQEAKLEKYAPDIAYQKWVLTQCGINVTDTYLVCLNSDYVRQGELDLQKLFVVIDMKELVENEYLKVPAQVSKALKVLRSEDELDIDLSEHCMKPYGCAFLDYCKRQHGVPDDEPTVFDLYRMNFAKKLEHYHAGRITFEYLRSQELSDKQQMQVECTLNQTEHIDREGIREFLNNLSYPLYFLDFETLQQTIPLYDGTKPYQQITFQYSLHIKRCADAPYEHLEFLAPNDGSDPRRSLAEQLCKDIPMNVCILAYNKGFECGRIRELAGMYPDLAVHLLNIREHIQDLLDPFRDGYYYVPAMHGSFSIKSVLPALFPDEPSLNYHNLDERCQNGGNAMTLFPRIQFMELEEAKASREALLRYCELDTWAMVKVWEKLKEVVE
ncbi:protein of unknown function [Prevotella communis]|uniref:DUF2779 domain-containing protein n=1 Tax=Prevotella communis TaxID=2913614 RepID=A0A1G8AXN5_9BACT|nr:DUF2779 domain-containing protein [Prevotella communis]SDH25725.1 protein of unknown function [Prevotella communis]